MIKNRLSAATACPYCRDGVDRSERVVCAACMAPHHAECWDAHDRCSSCSEPESLRPESELYGASVPDFVMTAGPPTETRPPALLDLLVTDHCNDHHDVDATLAAAAGATVVGGLAVGVLFENADSLDDSPAFTAFLILAMAGVFAAVIALVVMG